jgi:hypothetical protein
MSAQGPDVQTVSITKECLDVQTPVEWERTIKRVGKYIDRGFTADFSSAIERFKNKFRMEAARDWNDGVLNRFYVTGDEIVHVLKHLKLPYWTRSGGQYSVGADLVLGGKILCHIDDTRPMCQCGNARVVGKARWYVVCHDCAVEKNLNINKIENMLPAKFEIGDTTTDGADAADVAYIAEFNSCQNAIYQRRTFDESLYGEYRATFATFEEIGIFKSNADRYRMLELMKKHNGNKKLAFQEFTATDDDEQ